MKKILFLILPVFLLSVVFNIPPAKKAYATFDIPKVTICHKQEGPDVTISVSISALPAHLAHGDKLGACVYITPSPSPSPSPTPTIEPDPTVTPEPSITPAEEPTATPSAQPEQPRSESHTDSNSAGVAPVCGDGNTVKLPANVHVIRSGDTATVNFFITEGDSANIYYKEVNSPSWQYSRPDVKPNADNFVSVTIGDLDPVGSYTFGVQQKKGCGGGELVTAVVVDGPQSMLFHFSYWEWSK